MKQSHRFHYGIWVCMGCSLIFFCTGGLAVNAFSVFQPYILSLNQFTNAQTSSIITVRSFFSFISMLLCGFFYRHISLRVGMGLSGMTIALGFFLFGLAKSLPVYYLAAAIVGLGNGCGTVVPIAICLEHWFVRKRSLAISIASASTGLSTLGIPTLITNGIQRLGMRAVFFIEASCIAVLALISFLLIRDHPENIGLKPYGIDSNESEKNIKRVNIGYLTSGNWILLVPVMLCMGAVSSTSYSHMTVLFTSEGFDPQTVALAISVSGIALTTAKLLYGFAADRLKHTHSNGILGICMISGMLIFSIFLRNKLWLFISVVLYSTGVALSTVGPSVWTGDLNPSEKYDKTIHRLQTLYTAGGLLFSTVPGIIADRCNGSYLPAYRIFTCFAVLIICIIQWTYRNVRKRGLDSSH